MKYHYYEIGCDGFVNIEFDSEWGFVDSWGIVADIDELTVTNEGRIYIITEEAMASKSVALRFKDTLQNEIEAEDDVMGLSEEESYQMLNALDEIIEVDE